MRPSPQRAQRQRAMPRSSDRLAACPASMRLAIWGGASAASTSWSSPFIPLVAARPRWRCNIHAAQVWVHRHMATHCIPVEGGSTSATRASMRSRSGLPASPWPPPSPPWNTCSPSVGCVAACAPAVGGFRLSLGVRLRSLALRVRTRHGAHGGVQLSVRCAR